MHLLLGLPTKVNILTKMESNLDQMSRHVETSLAISCTGGDPDDANGSPHLGLKSREQEMETRLTLMATLLHVAREIFNQVGRSRRSVKTSSSSSRLLRLPSPFRVLTLILLGDRFLVNLMEEKNIN